MPIVGNRAVLVHRLFSSVPRQHPGNLIAESAEPVPGPLSGADRSTATRAVGEIRTLPTRWGCAPPVVPVCTRVA